MNGRTILAVSSVLILSTQPSCAGFFKDRIKQRIVSKLEAEPAPEASADVAAKIEKSGDYTFTFSHGNIDRYYRVHVPKSYDSKIPVPLIISMHGGGGDMMIQSSDEYYKLNLKSDASGFVVVYPNGYSKFKSGKLSTWNAGNCCAWARDEKIDDVGFIKEVLKKVSGQLNIDSARVFAIGMSNGGMMAYRLACEAGSLFKGIAAVAGTDNTNGCASPTPISVLHIHAKNDDHVLFNGGAGKTFRDESKVTNFTSVPNTIQKWTAIDKCEGAPVRIVDKKGAYCELYSKCQSTKHVQLCVTEDGAHSWPGGKKVRGGEAGSKALYANDVIWDFFQTLQ
tara:strand:- start:84345 stop:85358 length:1014 start_codon:yes stop_codon:yes gene_type:complete